LTQSFPAWNLFLEPVFFGFLLPHSTRVPRQVSGVGDLSTADPLDPKVAAWWADTLASVGAAFAASSGGVQSFGGLLLKADSEGMPGPST